MADQSADARAAYLSALNDVINAPNNSAAQEGWKRAIIERSTRWLAPADSERLRGDLLSHLTPLQSCHAMVSALHPPPIKAASQVDASFSFQLESLRSFGFIDALVLIDLAELTADSVDFAARAGISLPILEAIGSDLIGNAGEEMPEARYTDSDTDAENKMFDVGACFVHHIYEMPFFRNGGLVTLDPITGERLVSTHSFFCDSLHIAYRFEGREIFYVFAGGINGAIRATAFPRLNCLVLNLNYGEGQDHKNWSKDLYARLMANLMAHADTVPAIFAAKRSQTGVAVGFWPNFGHYVWQDLAGLEEIVLRLGADVVSHIVEGPHSFFPIKDLYPEFAGRLQHHVASINDFYAVFASMIDLPFQFLRPIGVIIRASLADRIVAAAERVVPARVQREMAAVAGRATLVWVTLRANVKVWKQQVEGHVIALRRLSNAIGPVAVVIDGWENTAVDALALRRALEPDIEVIDALGCTPYESVLWAKASHLYSGVVGSQMFINSYLARRPGVAHGNKSHLQQAAYWNEMAPGCCPPLFLAGSDVTGGVEWGSHYDFDPDLLYRGFLDLVQAHYPHLLAA